MDKSVDCSRSRVSEVAVEEADSTDFSGATSDGFSIIVPSPNKSLSQEHNSSINERLICDIKTGGKIHNGKESTLACDKDNLNHTTSPSKKPSYLNLSCSVSGYSNITTYDSKLRQDINKSREVSPIRPITNIIQYSKLERNNFLLIPVPIGNSLVLPDYSRGKSVENILGSEIIDKSKMSSNSKSSHTITNDSHDVTDTSSVFRSKQIFCASSPESCVTSHYTSKKVFAVSSEKVNETDAVHTVTPSKSFIQQRVERLYGPGALAQGFFNYKRYKNKNDRLENQENIQISSSNIQNRTSKEETVLQSKNSPDLPVFRHLRPEFCAQLPLASPKKDYKITKHNNKEILDQNGFKNNIDTPKANGALITRNKNTELDENVDSTLKLELSKNNIEITKELENNCSKTSSCNEQAKDNNTTIQKDGHYFLTILNKERNRLLDLANKTELELEALQLSRQDISEEILGYLRSGAGKARLLATQKLQQFEGLCHNNLNRKDDEQFPTTSADLEGFWDMVMLQVVHIDTLFEDINKMRQNNWEIIVPESPASRKPVQPKRPISTSLGLSSASSTKTSDKKNINREAAQKREEQRKKFVEMKRKAAREKKVNIDDDNIEVFIPRS